ncbi:MAG: amidohydrolase family protein [Planctomycetes bacterium]|nr:amidohydrolase family protein [Planctomycetota bacterium]
MNPLRSLLAATAAALPLCAQDVLAVKAGKLLTITGPTLENAVVLLQNGRITKVGAQAEVEIPWTAKVIDASDQVVLPTWVLAHSQGGVRGLNENMQNVPWLSVADAIEPASVFFEDCLRAGVGTIHVLPGNQTLLGGSGMVVRPYGRTIEDMAVAANTGLKLSLQASGGGRLQQIRKLRRALDDIRDYASDFARRKAEFEQEKAAGAIPADKAWTEQYDRTKKPAVDLVQKKAKGWLFVPTVAETEEALRLAKDLDLVLVFGANIDEAVPLLAKWNQPVVLDDSIEYYELDEETQKERKVCTAKLLADAGVPFALSLGLSGPTKEPWWQLGTCVRSGISRQQALEALTMVPARLLGLEAQLGSITEGKLGNLQILSGDPLAATSWVETVVLDGQVVYERRKDPRLQYLFGMEQDKAKKAAGPETPAEKAAAPAEKEKPAEKPAEKAGAEPKRDEAPTQRPVRTGGGQTGGGEDR